MADITHILGGSWQPPEKRIDPPEVQLLDEIERSGIEPDLDHVVIDGNLHRFNTGGRKGKTGWYIAFADGVPAGKFGCWRQDIEQTWRAETGKELTAADRMAHARRMDEAKKKRDEEKQKAHEIAENVVAKIWEQAQPAADDHPYLKKKGVSAHGARVTGDGRLIVPLFNGSGALISLQYISHDNGKQYHGKGKTQGGHWVLGDIESDGEIYIVEGFATAATVHEVTGMPCVISYSAGNLTPVTGTICAKYPDRPITIIADNDKGGVGKNHAEQASAKYGVRHVMPPIEDMDANDWVQAGYDLNDILSQAEVEEWLEPVTADWLSQPAPLKWMIKGWMPEQCLGMMHGPSGAGKTFVILSMLLHVATGTTWNGHKTKPGCIVYLAGEGNYGIRSRLAAWAQHHDQTDIDMWVSRSGCNLNTSDGWTHAMQYLRRVAATHTIMAVCVDTLHRFLHGDENSAEDAKTMIDACDAMKRELKTSVWLVHHTGLSHDAQDRGRGSSAWRGALDVEIGLRAPDDNKPGVIIQHKMKDAEAAPPQQFSLDNVDIEGWTDEDGEQVKGAVVTWCGEYEAPHKQTPIEKAAKAFYSAWQALGSEYDNQGRPCVSANRWIDWLQTDAGGNTKASTAEKKVKRGEKGQASHTARYLKDNGKLVDGEIDGMLAFVDDELFAQYRSAGNILKGKK